ncbi:MAG TPA: reverse transcriptase domain-containing protein [Pseudolabrys sp.]|jgi:hypothetical protein|nr:reverse transcriptase domain-containing protein [Pseudolabrys sp.]
MLGTYIHRFALPKGHQVFVPSTQARHEGSEIQAGVRRQWRAPPYYYHLRVGGHVSALKVHLANQIFATLDICGFFDSVTRSKIHRALRRIGVQQEPAREIAQRSTVEKTDGRRNFSLPYGFVQSPILASPALDKSGLGRVMKAVARSNHTKLTSYVDDIILSGIEEDAVEASRLALIAAAQNSGFAINIDKSQRCASEVTAFNIRLSNGSMAITERRMQEFETALERSDPRKAVGIVSYVRSVNHSQAEELAKQIMAFPEGEVRDAVLELAANWPMN